MLGLDWCRLRHVSVLLRTGRMLRDLLHKPLESPYEGRTVAAVMNMMEGGQTLLWLFSRHAGRTSELLSPRSVPSSGTGSSGGSRKRPPSGTRPCGSVPEYRITFGPCFQVPPDEFRQALNARVTKKGVLSWSTLVHSALP